MRIIFKLGLHLSTSVQCQRQIPEKPTRLVVVEEVFSFVPSQERVERVGFTQEAIFLDLSCSSRDRIPENHVFATGVRSYCFQVKMMLSGVRSRESLLTRLAVVEGVFRFVPSQGRVERAGLAQEGSFPSLSCYRFLIVLLATGLWPHGSSLIVRFVYVLQCP